MGVVLPRFRLREASLYTPPRTSDPIPGRPESLSWRDPMLHLDDTQAEQAFAADRAVSGPASHLAGQRIPGDILWAGPTQGASSGGRRAGSEASRR